jgi:hypothetical protein
VLVSSLEGGGAHGPGNRSPLSWTLKSTRQLARELSEAKHPVSYVKVGQILKDLGYSLKSNKKVRKDSLQPDPVSQYRLISSEVSLALEANQPVVYLQSRLRAQWPTPQDEEGSLEERKAPGVLNFAVGLISEWWNAGGSRPFQDFKSLLLIFNEGPAAAAPVDAASATEPGDAPTEPAQGDAAGVAVKNAPLPLRVLKFPVGTHRWNLSQTEIFSFVSREGGEVNPKPLTTRAFLLSKEERDPVTLSGKYFVELEGPKA